MKITDDAKKLIVTALRRTANTDGQSPDISLRDQDLMKKLAEAIEAMPAALAEIERLQTLVAANAAAAVESGELFTRRKQQVQRLKLLLRACEPVVAYAVETTCSSGHDNEALRHLSTRISAALEEE